MQTVSKLIKPQAFPFTAQAASKMRLLLSAFVPAGSS
jgi:hypothetical protein